MNKRLTSLLSSIAIFALLTGCSTDRLEAINFPETAKPSKTISLSMVNVYTYLNITKKVMSAAYAAQRDSVHLMIRVPNGYEVTNVKSAVLKDLNMNTIFGNINNISSLTPLLAQYITQLGNMSRDANLDGKFKGLTFDAHSAQSRTATIPITTDQGTWVGYSAPFNVSIKAGDTLDTIVAIDSIMGMISQMGVDTSTINKDSIMSSLPLPVKIDSIAFTSVPALIQVTLKTKSTSGTDTLCFYSTTSSKFPSQTEIDGGSTIDLGSMLFTELKVSDSAASVITHMNKFEQKNLSINMNPSHCIIQYKSFKKSSQKAISIYSPNGIVIKKIALSENGYAIWNYTYDNGASVSSGRYFVTIGHSRSDVIPIDVIR
jgi:hypothetical protein